MFPYNFLILPLVGGYFVISSFVYYKYKYQRFDTPRLLLNAILAGIIIGTASFALRRAVEIYSPDLFDRLCRILHFFPIERNEDNRYLGTLSYGLVLVLGLTIILNVLIKWGFGVTSIISDAIDKYGDELEQLLRDSVVNGQAVQLTLKNEKVYLGVVQEIQEPKKTNYVTLIPLYSGYRDKDTKKMKLTTSYETITQLIDQQVISPKIDQMLVIIKKDEILIAQPHDPEIYSSFMKAHGGEDGDPVKKDIS